MHGYKISLSSLIKYLIYLYIFIMVTSVNTGTMPVKVIRVVLAAALVLYIIKVSGFRINTYIGWAFFFLLYNAVMTQFALYKSLAIDYTTTLLYIVIINVGICLFMLKHDVTAGMIKALIVSTIVEAVITFGQHGLFVFMNTRRTDEGSANILGFYAAMSFVFSYIFYKKYKGKKQGKIYACACIICLLIALLSASRKALIFAFVPVIVYWILSSKNPIKSFRNVIAAIILVAVLYYCMMHISVVYNLVGRRIESMIAGFMGDSTDSSTSTRLRLIEAGMGWFREKPWFGYGLSNFRAINAAVRGSIFYAHNNYVELLVDCGLVGTIMYYFLYVQIILLIIKNKRMDRFGKGFILGIAICFLVGDYGMVSYNLPIFQLILMGLYMAASGKSTILSGMPNENAPAVEAYQTNRGGSIE